MMKIIIACSPRKMVVVHRYSLPVLVNIMKNPTGNITSIITVRIFKDAG